MGPETDKLITDRESVLSSMETRMEQHVCGFSQGGNCALALIEAKARQRGTQGHKKGPDLKNMELNQHSRRWCVPHSKKDENRLEQLGEVKGFFSVS